jgi:hypothetical protein
VLRERETDDRTRRCRRWRRSEHGYALLFTLFVAIFVELAALLAAAVVLNRFQATEQRAREARLTALCDAAIAETLAQLARNPSFAGIAHRSADPDGSDSGAWISSTVAVAASRSFLTVTVGIGPLQRDAEVVADRINGRLRVTAFR